MRQAGRKVRESARIQDVDLIADPNLEPTAENVDRLFLPVVNVKRGPPPGPTSTMK